MSILNPQDWNQVERLATVAELRQWEAKSMALDFAAEAHSRAVEIELKGV